MWKHVQVDRREYEELNQIAEYVIDNETDIYNKIIAHNPNFHMIYTTPLVFYPTQIRNIYNYCDNSYSLGISLENIGRIIRTFRIRLMQEYTLPPEEDPIMKDRYNHFGRTLREERVILANLRSFLFGESRSNYGILPITFICSYDKKDDLPTNPFTNYHSNIAVFDKRNRTWMMIEPHGHLHPNSRKYVSCIRSFKHYIRNFENYQYKSNSEFSIPLNIPEKGVQGSDYLCVAWACYLLDLMVTIYNQGGGEVRYDLHNEHMKRGAIVSFLKKVKECYKNVHMKFAPFNRELQPFLPLNYVKSYIFFIK